MSDFYVFFRMWQHFTKRFPFDDFNSLPDTEIYDALDEYALTWLRTNKAEAKNLLRNQKRDLKHEMARRQGQFLRRASGDAIHVHLPIPNVCLIGQRSWNACADRERMLLVAELHILPGGLTCSYGTSFYESPVNP